ncbi:MAG TPA: hypothetical protein VGI81_14635 [Tepidisphaeraceae bacterium]|jgi:Spy/CpxP family protein refolding chaperone
MSFSKSLWMCGAALLMGTAVLAADSGTSGAKAAGETPAAATPATPRAGRARLTKPWNELKDLTEEERTKIIAVHQKALDEVHAIEAKEHADILALLTDEQKKEVAELEAKAKEAQRTARSKKPTTQPVGASASTAK